MQRSRRPRPWSIVLAGGNGERLRAFTELRFGSPLPKQYCAFVGTRSMLEHTVDRACRLSGPERTVTVIAHEHAHLAASQLGGGRRGAVIEQPGNRDTAAGILLPLAYVLGRDPGASVVIFPSDHFVFPEDRFLDAVATSVLAAERLGDRLVLMGVAPLHAERDYGWITPGDDLGCFAGRRLRAAAAFVEKPNLATAEATLAGGGLWNTLIIAARAELLWTLGWCYLPQLMPAFEALRRSAGSAAEVDVLESIYGELPSLNFSSHLLQPAAGHVAVLELDDVTWSDWGRPERIAESLSATAADHRAVATGTSFEARQPVTESAMLLRYGG